MFFYPLAFQAEGVLSLAAFVHPSVSLSVTRLWFELESLKLHQTGIMRHSQLVLKMKVIDLDFQSHFGDFDLEL